MKPDLDVLLEGALAIIRSSPNDEAAWRTIYRQLWPLVFSIAYRRLGGSREDASDAAQEVFIRLLRAAPEAELSSASALRAYAGLIARNVAIDRLRAIQREGHSRSDIDLASGSSQDDPEALAEAEDSFRGLLATLEGTERDLITLLVKGYSNREIAAALGITYGAVRVRVHRVRAKLSKLLRPHTL